MLNYVGQRPTSLSSSSLCMCGYSTTLFSIWLPVTVALALASLHKQVVEFFGDPFLFLRIGCPAQGVQELRSALPPCLSKVRHLMPRFPP